MKSRGLILVAFLALLAVPATAAGTKPNLKLVTMKPLVVRGELFHPGERVTITRLTLLGPRVVHVRAGARGGFRVQLGAGTQPCGKTFAVRARGASGSVAVLWLATGACVPPPVD